MLVKCKTLHGDYKDVPVEKLEIRPSAYAAVVNDGRMLLVRTKTTGKYWFPGGAVELGESIENALRREVVEESGIKVEVGEFLTFKEIFFYYEPLDEAYQSYAFFYACKPLTFDICDDDQVDPGDEAEKPRWVNINSLKENDFQDGIWDVVEKIRNEK